MARLFFNLIILLVSSAGIFCRPVMAETGKYPPFKIGLSYESVSSNLSLKPSLLESQHLDYRPGASAYEGVIIGYRWVAGTISFALPPTAKAKAEEGTTTYRDYKLSYFGRRLGVEANYNSFKGYLIENSSNLSAATLAGEKYYKLPEMKSQGYGINLYFVFNPTSYLMPAAIDQSEPISKSGGSWIALFSARRMHFSNPSPFVPTANQSSFMNDQMMSTFSLTKVSLGQGYAFLLKGPASLFLSGLFGIGVGFQDLDYYNTDNGNHEKYSPQGDAHLKLAFGLNGRHGFFKVALSFDYFDATTGAIKIGNLVTGGVFSMGVRI